MRFAVRWVTALVVPAMLLTGPLAQGQNKAKANKDKEPANTEKMIKAGLLTGKIAAVYEDKRMVRLQVPVPVLNPGALQSIQAAQIQMAQARLARDPVGMMQAQRSMILAQATLYTTRMQDVELTVIDDVVVRTAKPRENFDEKGKIKRYTRAELKELKGDPKLPGYKAEFGDVATDQVVQVTLVKKKAAPAPKPVAKPKPKPKAKGKAKGNEEEAAAPPVDLLADNLPQVSMIVIVADPPPSR
jgi:hypothetical protein